MKTRYNLFEFREVKWDDVFVDYDTVGFCSDILIRYRDGLKVSCVNKSRTNRQINIVKLLLKRHMYDATKNHCFPYVERISE